MDRPAMLRKPFVWKILFDIRNEFMQKIILNLIVLGKPDCSHTIQNFDLQGLQ